MELRLKSQTEQPLLFDGRAHEFLHFPKIVDVRSSKRQASTGCYTRERGGQIFAIRVGGDKLML